MLKMVESSPADEIIALLKPIVDNIALVLTNGVIIFNNFDEDAIHPLVRFVKDLESQVQPGFFVRQDYLVSFRLSNRVFVLALSNLPDSDIIPLFSKLFENYSEKLNAFYQNPPKNVGDISKALLFAMALAEGPEPIAWVPPSFPHDQVLDYAIKSMLTLAGEWEGAFQNVVAYRPFIKAGILGVIFLFDIPDAKARGHAYDAALILLIDYRDRALIYEISQKLEATFILGATQLKSIWKDKKAVRTLLENIIASFKTIPLKLTALGETIKEQMLLSIQDLRKI